MCTASAPSAMLDCHNDEIDMLGNFAERNAATKSPELEVPLALKADVMTGESRPSRGALPSCQCRRTLCRCCTMMMVCLMFGSGSSLVFPSSQGSHFPPVTSTCGMPSKLDRVSRRVFVSSLSTAAVTAASSRPAHSEMFTKERRQLELCLVAVWRVVYWAESLEFDLSNASLPLETRKQHYLEARLAAKAMLTGKVGGGANLKVYTLGTLQLPDCLQDLEAYSASKSFGETRRELYESIASLVEFDGMDTLKDPSPRSSLTLTQYDTTKDTYVRRVLAERVIPLGKEIINSFPSENVAISQRYIQQNFPEEIFPRPETTESE